MLQPIRKYLARQAQKPFGWFGRTVASRVFDKENSEMNNFGFGLMSPNEDDHILEIGFGNGYLITGLLKKINNGQVCGIDISNEMVDLVFDQNKKWINCGLLDIKNASIEHIPYPDQYFDKVFTANTIYFWPQPEENINEVNRVLKPGGKFFCALRLKHQMESRGSIVTENRDVFKNLYQEDEVKRLFENIGFHDVDSHIYHGSKENLYIVAGTK